MKNSLPKLKTVVISTVSAFATLSACMALTTMSASFVASNTAHASGFELWEQDSAGIGDYHAGAAVDTDNTGIEFYNPAGMVFLTYNKPQVSTGVAYIPISTSFKGTIAGTPTPGWENGDTDNLVPNFHAIYPVSSKWALGFGVTTPFGLSTNYPAVAPIGYAATKTRLMTININPSVAYKVNDWLGFGFGINAQYGQADFNSLVPVLLSELTNHLSGWAWGWNIGTYIKPSKNSAIGIAYRSAVTFHSTGTGKSSNKQLNKNYSAPIKAKLPLPATLTISVEQQLNKLTLLATVERTWWSRFDNLVMTGLPNPLMQGEPFDLTSPFGYSDTWNIALGVHYWLSSRFMLKLGGGYDMTPTNDNYRDIRLPGVNRWAVSVGGRALLSKHIMMDMGWIHLISSENAKIDNQGPQAPALPITISTKGEAKMGGDVIGMQLTALF